MKVRWLVVMMAQQMVVKMVEMLAAPTVCWKVDLVEKMAGMLAAAKEQQLADMKEYR